MVGRQAVAACSDVEVVAAIARGEEWAAEVLYDRVQPVVDRTLRRLLRTRDLDHGDLVQAAFERILRVLGERKLGELSNLSAWSSVVATHVALDALRRRSREHRIFQPIVDDSDRSTEVSLERRLEARSEVERVQRVVARMKSKYAETVLLHDVLGHDLAEVARLTDVSVAAAQSRLVRGRKELLRRLKAEGRDV